MSPVSVRVGGVWKTATNVYTKVGGVWKTASDMPVKVGGVWKTGILLTGGFDSIATYTAAGGETSFDFSSIPQSYASLQLRVFARDTASGTTISGVRFRVNGSAGTYYSHGFSSNGATASSYNSGTTATYLQSNFGMPLNTTTANTFGFTIVDIFDYSSSTKLKVIRRVEGVDLNGTGNIARVTGLYNSTTAISQITVYPSTTAFAAGSIVALYGIKSS